MTYRTESINTDTDTPNGFITLPNAQDGFTSECNSAGASSGSTQNTNSLCNPNNDPVDINNSISQINTLIASNGQTQFSSENAKRSELALLERCLIKLQNQLASYFLQNNQIQNAISVYQNHLDFGMQIKGYSIYMNQRDYVNARTYLLQLNTTNHAELEFVQSSLIFLDAIETGDAYTLTPSDQNKIYDAAIKESPLAGYSRSIWMYFMNQDIEMEVNLPNGSDPRSIKHEKDMSSLVGVNPNPARGHVQFQLNEQLTSEQYIYELLDLSGQLIKTGFITKYKETVDISDIASGVFIVRIFDYNQEVLKVQKLIIQND